MKKWFFSNNGEVSAPLDLDEAKDYLAENPDVYGWHPSFNQWKPVNCISEFVDVVPATVQIPPIPKEISDKFLAKKQRLQSKLTSIDDSVSHTQSSLLKFEQQIEDYKEMTKNLNDDVKGAIVNIEKKYKTLSRKLSQVKDAVHIAVNEMDEVVENFDRKMSSNDIFMPSCNPAPANGQPIKTGEVTDISKAKRAQEKLATPHKRVEKTATPDKVERAETTRVEEPKKEKVEAKKTIAKKETVQPKADTSDDTKETFTGMKSMMKSVFKGDSKIEKVKEDPKKAKEEPLSMAERLKMAQNNQ